MQDRYGHRISYLRVSITDRCNERCTYCMPQELQEWLPREEILTFEETLRIVGIAAELGVSKVRVTGGEPLTRRDVVHFISQIPKIPGIRSLGLSTNGTLLARQITAGKTMAMALREAGCSRSTSHSIRCIGMSILRSPAGIFTLRSSMGSMPRSQWASIR